MTKKVGQQEVLFPKQVPGLRDDVTTEEAKKVSAAGATVVDAGGHILQAVKKGLEAVNAQQPIPVDVWEELAANAPRLLAALVDVAEFAGSKIDLPAIGRVVGRVAEGVTDVVHGLVEGAQEALAGHRAKAKSKLDGASDDATRLADKAPGKTEPPPHGASKHSDVADRQTQAAGSVFDTGASAPAGWERLAGYELQDLLAGNRSLHKGVQSEGARALNRALRAYLTELCEQAEKTAIERDPPYGDYRGEDVNFYYDLNKVLIGLKKSSTTEDRIGDSTLTAISVLLNTVEPAQRAIINSGPDGNATLLKVQAAFRENKNVDAEVLKLLMRAPGFEQALLQKDTERNRQGIRVDEAAPADVKLPEPVPYVAPKKPGRAAPADAGDAGDLDDLREAGIVGSSLFTGSPHTGGI